MEIIIKLQQYSRSLIVAIIVLANFGLAITPTAISYATAKEDVCNAIDGTVSGDNCDTGDTSVNDVIRVVINVLSILVGVIAVIMIIVGGLKYITSGGDSNSISSAKNTLTYALVGLVIAALSQIIAQFVVGRVT